MPSAARRTEPSGPRSPKLVPMMFTHATADTQASGGGVFAAATVGHKRLLLVYSDPTASKLYVYIYINIYLHRCIDVNMHFKGIAWYSTKIAAKKNETSKALWCFMGGL